MARMAQTRLLATLGGLAASALLAATPAAAEMRTFTSNSPADPFHRWVVPANVCSAVFDLYGAEGSGGVGGARVTTTLAVSSGSSYEIYVGGWGKLGSGGYNGGGAASNNGVGGGGATDVRTGPSLAQRILVAGGGGGNGGAGGGYAAGLGGGGGLIGQNGGQSGGNEPVYYSGGGGGGATGTAGGAAGQPGPPVPPYGGQAGALGVGGAGGSPISPDNSPSGGGGGGGLYGGGGGGAGGGGYPGGGGGGGSSLAAGGTVTATGGGDGKAIVTYTVAPGCDGKGQPPGGGGPAGGGGGGGGADVTAPALSGLIFARGAFAAAKSGASISATRKRKPKVGSQLSFLLSESASVKFDVERKVRVSKGRLRWKWKAVKGSFSFAGKHGLNTLKFRGRVGGKSLAPGSYRLTGQATDGAGNKSAVQRKGFRIVG
jgi:hypothetical protein